MSLQEILQKYDASILPTDYQLIGQKLLLQKYITLSKYMMQYNVSHDLRETILLQYLLLYSHHESTKNINDLLQKRYIHLQPDLYYLISDDEKYSFLINKDLKTIMDEKIPNMVIHPSEHYNIAFYQKLSENTYRGSIGGSLTDYTIYPIYFKFTNNLDILTNRRYFE